MSIRGGIWVALCLMMFCVGGTAIFDTEHATPRRSVTMIDALHRYHAEHGRYPDELEVLVPQYLNRLWQPKTMWGWLYAADETAFHLGYVFYIDRYGYSVCVVGTDMPEWDCVRNSTELFDMPTTPFPPTYVPPTTP